MPPPPQPDFTAMANHYEQLCKQVAQQAEDIKQLNKQAQQGGQVKQLRNENNNLRKEVKKLSERVEELNVGLQAVDYNSWVRIANHKASLGYNGRVSAMCDLYTAEIIEGLPTGTLNQVRHEIDCMAEGIVDDLLAAIVFFGLVGLSLDRKRETLKSVMGL
ncbi:hypothetical protein FKW77_002584 [Venturia effusa]|uniref:Uncharacterized protein n=1 Tax=Venturia effusa TaxID=50376 RepID=A0A517LML4_9PEZI|nr:hypothetical protein FKW77_002584 [Venturia effusa]